MENQDMVQDLINLGINSGLERFQCDLMTVRININESEVDGVKLRTLVATLEDPTIPYKVRAIQGPIEKIFTYIQSILLAYNSVKENPLFYEVLGFSIKNYSLDEIEFSLLSAYYPYNICFVARRSKQKPEKKISKIFKAIIYLHSKGFFHGFLTPDTIFVVENKIKIELNFFVFQIHEFQLKNYLYILKSLNIYNQYLAPEVIFASNQLEYNYEFVDPKAIDLFAAGCIGLKIYKEDQEPFIFNFSRYNFNLLLINQNIDCLYQSIDDPFERETILNSINNFEDNIKKNIKKCDKLKICKLIELATSVFISERVRCTSTLEQKSQSNSNIIKMDKLMEVAKAFYKIISEIQSINFTIEVKNERSETEIIKIRKNPEPFSSSKMYVLTVGYNQYTLSSHDWDKFYETLMTIGYTLDKYGDDLSIALDSFNQISCGCSDVKIIDGSMIFFNTSLKFLYKNKIGFFQLSCLLKSQKLIPITDFLMFFDELEKSSSVSQSFIVFSLIMTRIEKDFFYFFNRNLLSKLSFTKFNDFSVLITEFRTILEKKFIMDCLKLFNASDVDTQQTIERLLENVYLTSTTSSCCGLSTYNQYIFISRGTPSIFKHIGDHQRRVVIYIILLHELANVLRRVNCNTFKEARNTLTPISIETNKKIVYDEDYKTERERRELKGEAGFSLEEMIFGKPVINISREAAEYLLFGDSNITLNCFTENFKKKQSEGTGNIGLERGGCNTGGLLPIRCSFSNSKYS